MDSSAHSSESIERELRRLERLLEGTGHVLWQLDAKGEVLVDSRSWRNATGQAPEEFRGWGWLDAVQASDRSGVVGALREAAAKQALVRIEVQLRAADGMFRAAVCHFVPNLAGDGSIRDWSCIASDNAELHMLRSRMAIADRRAGLGTMAASLIHEINNPLSFLGMNLATVVEQLRERATSGLDLSREIAAAEDATAGVERIAAIVHDVRAFVSTDTSEAGSADVVRALEAAITLSGNEIRHRAELIREFAAVGRASGRESRLVQVFLNLLSNAAKSIPIGSADRHRIHVRVGARAGDIVVEIADTGVGMPDEVLGRVFEPFFTTMGEGGLGLGLSICKNMIESMGGRIEIESKAGVGTTVRLFLRPSEARDAAEDELEAAQVAVPRARVLVIDDEEMVCTAVSRLLNREHDVITFTSAREALSFIVEGYEPDVILCDLMMPDLMGMDFAAILADGWPRLAKRIVFLTGGAFTRVAADFLEATPNLRLEKPFSSNDLRRALATILTAS